MQLNPAHNSNAGRKKPLDLITTSPLHYKTSSVPKYTSLKFDPELYKQVRIRAAENDETIGAFMERAMRRELTLGQKAEKPQKKGSK